MIVCAASTSKDTGNEDLNTDTDQNHAAQNGCFPGKAGTEALTDAEPEGTDNKSYSSEEQITKVTPPIMRPAARACAT